MGTCRLCLKSLCGSPVIALESSMRTSINFVLPEINLDISTTPAVCKACCDIIQSLYQFKVNCIEIEEKIRAKTSGGYVKLNLKEIFSNLLTKKKEERLCRTCLCSIDCQSFTVLQPSEPDPYLDSMLIMCLPELDMELCRDPVMCQKCLDSLQKLYNLKTTCLEVEEKLKNYHFAQGTNIDAQINLQEAMESFSNETGLVNIKKEAEIDLVDEKYPDDATQAIKEEEIDIKEESIADKEPKVLRSVKCNKNLGASIDKSVFDKKDNVLKQRAKEAYINMQQALKRRNDRDTSSSFGEHIANKHRAYNRRTRSTVEHLISNILFKADMGRYEEYLNPPLLVAISPQAYYRSPVPQPTRTATPILDSQQYKQQPH